MPIDPPEVLNRANHAAVPQGMPAGAGREITLAGTTLKSNATLIRGFACPALPSALENDALITSVAALNLTYDEKDLEAFTRGYVLAWLYIEHLPAPELDDPEDWLPGATFFDAGPFYLFDVTDGSWVIAQAHCRVLLDEIAHLIPGGRSEFEGREFEQAGHDAGLTCQGLHCGFDEPPWLRSVGSKLAHVCYRHGGLSVEPHKGRILITRRNDRPTDHGDGCVLASPSFLSRC